MDGQPPILRTENMVKRYQNKAVLNNVALDIAKGEIKVLIGPSGAGKSTLLHCLNVLTIPDEGRIWLDGEEIDYHNNKTRIKYRQRLGMIFQDFNLFDHLDAQRNITIGLIKVKKLSKTQARERAMAELERVGLEEHYNKYPAELSGGQKQRVSIARALAMDPEVILLDEPTSALDPELMGEVLAVIRKLAAGGMTMIMATHEINFAENVASEMIFMEDGVIVEKGPPKQILYDGQCERARQFCTKLGEL